MSKAQNDRKKIRSILESIKKINDRPNKLKNVEDQYLRDLSDAQLLNGKKISQFGKKKGKSNNENIFGELLDISNQILSGNNKVSSSDRLSKNIKLKQNALDASKKTIEEGGEIVLDSVKKIFFVGDGICGTNQTITGDTLTISPSEIDFINMLTIDPNSTIGKIIYEDDVDIGKEKVNKELYNTFSNSSYDLNTLSGRVLFNTTWEANSQTFKITGLTQNGENPEIKSFINDYYSSIELPNLNSVIKNAMLMTLQGNLGSKRFGDSLNKLDRLLNRLFKICGSTNRDQNIQFQNAVDIINENDEDIQSYFDFNSVEGIDFDAEDARIRGVLKFKDCDNFETPVDDTMLEDFVFLLEKKDTNSLVNNTFTRMSAEASSNSGLPESSFNISLLNSFILNLPKAIISTLLTPKILLPIVITYKLTYPNENNDADSLMRKLWRLFYLIISKLFWSFIRSFWNLVKTDLLAFVGTLVTSILKNKYKRYVLIISALIVFLRRLLENDIDNCGTLFGTLLNTINGLLSSPAPFRVPGLLLSFSDLLPGYSQDRSLLNITERLEASGIPTGPLYGDDNDLPTVIKSIIDGHTEEMDKNSYVKISLKPGALPGPTGGAVIPPGVITGVGKMF